MGGDFGGNIRGIFSDEPNYSAMVEEYASESRADVFSCVPWTPKLPDAFRGMHGYSILEHLPELFFEVEGVMASKARLDFRNCATHLFVTHYLKQIHDWCEAHSLQLTGHLLLEGSMHVQAHAVGAAMRAYEYMQLPGVDILTENGHCCTE